MKKIISLILCAVTVLCATVSVSARVYESEGDKTEGFYYDEGDYLLGDVDGDGEQNGKDALAIKATVAGLEGYSVIAEAADFNGDGMVDAKDSYLMKTCLAGTNSFDVLDGEYQIYNLTIGGNSVKDYAIVVPEGCDPATSNTYYAAEEMQTYIEAATGVFLDIYEGSAPTEHVIRYHSYEVDTPENLEMGLRLENFKYTVKNGDLDIYGSLRGNMYATYEIIEEYIGIRFIDGKFTYIFKNRTVDIPEGTDVFYAPKVDYRQVNHTFDDEAWHDDLNYHNPVRLNGNTDFGDPRYGTWTGIHYAAGHSFGYCHRMATGTLPDESFGTVTERYTYKFNTGIQPDWATWQPCATSESEYKLLFEGLVELCIWVTSWGDIHVFRCFEEYGISSMSFSIEDNQNYCTCRNCNKKSKTEGYSGVYVDLSNRAAQDIQAYYPGLKINTIIYDHTVPKTVRPHDMLVVMYCGPCCNNHALGSGGCGDNKTVLGSSNACCEAATKAWGELCRETGAEMWFYYYPVSYHFYLTGCPNIFEIYYDFTYLINECGFNGVYYEGGGETYLFEKLKAHMAARLLWKPEMSFEEFTQIMKEYLYITYGDGYEYIYEYIVHIQAAGDATGCFINNHDGMWDMYSWKYIAENYEEMRALLLSARELCKREDQTVMVDNLIMSCDTLGLSAVHGEWYLHGTEETRAVYEERYTDLYNYIKDNNIRMSDFSQYVLPETIDFSENLAKQFFNGGAWDGNDQPDSQYAIDFQSVTVGGYVYAYMGEECEGYARAEGAELYRSSKPSVASVDDKTGALTLNSPGVTLIGYEKDGVQKAYVVCVFAEGEGPDRSAGDAQIFEKGTYYTHSAVIGATQYFTSNKGIVDVSDAPRLYFKGVGYAAVTASNASRPFVYSFIVYDRTVE